MNVNFDHNVTFSNFENGHFSQLKGQTFILSQTRICVLQFFNTLPSSTVLDVPIFG